MLLLSLIITDFISVTVDSNDGTDFTELINV